MYKAKLKIYKEGEKNCIELNLGIFLRPSTAKQKVTLTKYNPNY